MSNVIPFPDRPPGPTGYCGACHHEISVPTNSAWPQQCPYCKASPLCVVSDPNVTVAFSTIRPAS